MERIGLVREGKGHGSTAGAMRVNFGRKDSLFASLRAMGFWEEFDTGVMDPGIEYERRSNYISTAYTKTLSI